MRIDTLTVGMFQSNCFVVSCEETREAIVIDPGDEGDRILAHVNLRKLDVKAVVCTHGHIDHVAALPVVAPALGCPVLMHSGDLPLYENIHRQAMLFGLETPGRVKIDRVLAGGEKVAFGKLAGEVIHTPGHSPGGVCLAFAGTKPPVVFVGDVLFRGSIGRTDLMGASEREMMKTLKEVILELPNEMIVYSGHGPETTIARERKSNPFLIDADGWDM